MQNGQRESGMGYRDRASAMRGPSGMRPERGTNRDGRQRNVGHREGEEHSRMADPHQALYRR